MRHTKLLIAIITFVVLPISFYFFVKKRRDQKIQWHRTEQPTRKDLTQYITASGRLKAQGQITIGSLVAGRIIKLHVDDNDFVKKDQILVELDNGIGYSAVKRAKAVLVEREVNLAYQQNFYKRQKALYESSQLAKDAFEETTKNFEVAKAQVLQAQADLEIRQQEYDNLFIKAPEAGIVIAKKVDLGQMITARFQATELFTIAKDLKLMEAEIDIDESDIGLVEIGQEALFTVDAFPQRTFSAKIEQIHYDYKIIDNVITYAVILNVANDDLNLRPGMTTNVDVKVARAKNALCVPNKSLRVNRRVLRQVADKEHFSVEEIPQTVETKRQETLWIRTDSSFKEVPVTLGVTSGRFTEITEGLDPSMLVVTEVLDPDRQNPIFAVGKFKA